MGELALPSLHQDFKGSQRTEIMGLKPKGCINFYSIFLLIKKECMYVSPRVSIGKYRKKMDIAPDSDSKKSRARTLPAGLFLWRVSAPRLFLPAPASRQVFLFLLTCAFPGGCSPHLWIQGKSPASLPGAPVCPPSCPPEFLAGQAQPRLL